MVDWSIDWQSIARLIGWLLDWLSQLFIACYVDWSIDWLIFYYGFFPGFSYFASSFPSRPMHGGCDEARHVGARQPGRTFESSVQHCQDSQRGSAQMPPRGCPFDLQRPINRVVDTLLRRYQSNGLDLWQQGGINSSELMDYTFLPMHCPGGGGTRQWTRFVKRTQWGTFFSTLEAIFRSKSLDLLSVYSRRQFCCIFSCSQYSREILIKSLKKYSVR